MINSLIPNVLSNGKIFFEAVEIQISIRKLIEFATRVVEKSSEISWLVSETMWPREIIDEGILLNLSILYHSHMLYDPTEECEEDQVTLMTDMQFGSGRDPSYRPWIEILETHDDDFEFDCKGVYAAWQGILDQEVWEWDGVTYPNAYCSLVDDSEYEYDARYYLVANYNKLISYYMLKNHIQPLLATL